MRQRKSCDREKWERSRHNTNQTNTRTKLTNYNGGAGEGGWQSSEWFYMDTGRQTFPLRAHVRLSATTGSRDDANSSVTRDGNARGQAYTHIRAYVSVTNATRALRTAPLRSVYNTWTTPPAAIHLRPYIRSHCRRTHWLLRAQKFAHTERRFSRDLRALTMFHGEKKEKRRWRYLTIHLAIHLRTKEWRDGTQIVNEKTTKDGCHKIEPHVWFCQICSWESVTLSSTRIRLYALFNVASDLSTVLCRMTIRARQRWSREAQSTVLSTNVYRAKTQNVTYVVPRRHQNEM